MGAAALKIEELAIDDGEAKHLAEAVAEVGRHYNVVVDPKTQAWVNLCFALGAVYGPRVVAYRLRTASAREARRAARAAGNVTPIRPATNGAQFTATGQGAPEQPAPFS